MQLKNNKLPLSRRVGVETCRQLPGRSVAKQEWGLRVYFSYMKAIYVLLAILPPTYLTMGHKAQGSVWPPHLQWALWSIFFPTLYLWHLPRSFPQPSKNPRHARGNSTKFSPLVLKALGPHLWSLWDGKRNLEEARQRLSAAATCSKQKEHVFK